MTGWRIGFAANKALAPVFTRWITNTESCASQISQWAALQALTGPQSDADAMKQRFHARRDLIVRLLNAVPGFRCATPGRRVLRLAERDGGVPPDRCARLRGTAHAGSCMEAGVAVLADIHFGPRVEGEGQHIRFSYATSESAIEQGVDAHRRIHSKGRDERARPLRRRARPLGRSARSAKGAADELRHLQGTRRDPAADPQRAEARSATGRRSRRGGRLPRHAIPPGRGQRRTPTGWRTSRAMAERMASTVETVDAMRDAPAAVARYLATQGIASRAVAWPVLQRLAVGSGERRMSEFRPPRRDESQGADMVGITGVFLRDRRNRNAGAAVRCRLAGVDASAARDPYRGASRRAASSLRWKTRSN